MGTVGDPELYDRGAETLVASWAAYARGAEGADVLRLAGASIGVFPRGPERGVYNNALLERGLDAAARRRAVEEVEAAYAAAGVERYAMWVHETDEPMRSELQARAYALDTSTRVMGMALADLRVCRPQLEITTAGWPRYLEHLAMDELPDGLLAGVDPSAFHVLMARLDGEDLASGLAFDADGDCGIYNVSTLPCARRRGLGTAVTAALAHDALDRGCTTASLQATSAAERLYARLGFRDLGRFLELVPAPLLELCGSHYAGLGT
jgi:ribosomal protein S18 acetylase RimI-like enzyme